MVIITCLISVLKKQAYGYAYQGKDLMDVIEALSELGGLERLRLSSIEPTTISRDIFGYMNRHPSRKGGGLCRYLHLPLQSGDDEILQEMKRKYTVGDFSAFVRQAESKVPQICIGTDVIVGVPGETDAHFERTVDILRELPIHYFHVFSYSPRAMAKSRLKKTLPAEMIARRSQILRDLSQRKRRLFNGSLLGSTQRVLFERPKGDGWQNGLTDNYVRVKVKVQRDLFNQVLPVRLQAIEGQAIIGELSKGTL